MRYGLVLITHGQAPHLHKTLKSFERWVTPRPAFQLAIVDGNDDDTAQPPIIGQPWRVLAGPQAGFCEASRAGWHVGREMVEEHQCEALFWLENDFRFFRPVQLDLVGATLRRNFDVAQISLLRQPVNAREERYGILGADHVQHQGWTYHEQYFTTNPSLIRKEVLGAFDWPDGPECEGKLGLEIRQAGFGFGVWGDGQDPWVEHLGERTSDGRGY